MFDTICKLPDTESNKALLQELNTDWGEYKLAGFLCQDMVGLDCSLRRAKESGPLVVLGGDLEGGEEEGESEEGESKAEEWKREEVWEGREVNGEWREEKMEEIGGSEEGSRSRRGW